MFKPTVAEMLVYVKLAVRAIKAISIELGANKREVELLKVEIVPHLPWDAPTECRCNAFPQPVLRYAEYA